MAQLPKKKKGLSFNFLNRFMVIQFILMLILSLFITYKVNTHTKENATAQLSAIANERALIVDEFVDNAESKLRIFSTEPEIINMMQNMSDRDAVIAAQKCTERLAPEITGLEGLYTMNWNSKVLTHSLISGVGDVTHEQDALAELQAGVMEQHNKELNKEGSGVYNEGISVSPVTGHKVMYLYRGMFSDNGKPLGIVGLALNADVIMNKLSAIKAPGLENSTYTMMDVVKAAYIFDQDDPNNAGKPVVLPDLVRTCEEYRNGINTDISTTYEYALPHMGSFVGASVWLPDRNWILMMNDRSSEVYKLVYAMRWFLGIFSALILALMIVFTFLNKKQEQVNMKLVQSVERMNQAKHSLNAAMFNDVLTEVGNRVKLTISLSDVTDGQTNPYYFAMFNIMDFSSINTAFGSDTGDEVLVRTAKAIQDAFPNGSVYRTGSDEFVVMIRSENGSPRSDTMVSDVDNVLRTLTAPQNIEGVGTLYPKYKVSVIKKNTGIDPSVITILKEMTNARGEAMIGMIDFSDLTE